MFIDFYLSTKLANKQDTGTTKTFIFCKRIYTVFNTKLSSISRVYIDLLSLLAYTPGLFSAWYCWFDVGLMTSG